MAHPILAWIGIVVLAIVAMSVLALWSFGRFARRARGAPSIAWSTDDTATALDRLLQPLLIAHPSDASAAAFLGDPIAAFLARARSGGMAERSLDVQYYIWHHDVTGRLLELRLLDAASRGARVRVLVDDMGASGHDDEWLALDVHPNVEVRLFNPGRNRRGSLRRALEMGLRFIGFNRRMHNKAWIADNRVAIVGGRNVGDEYFGAAAETNFRDSDLLLLGAAVGEASAVFDRYWNSAEVIPLRALHRPGSRWSADRFASEREAWLRDAAATPWGKALAEADHWAELLAQGGLHLHWSPSIRVVSDPPEKAAPLARARRRSGWLLYDVLALLYSARHASWLISPYFVPGASGTLLLAGQVQRGMQVRVLTNSLAANDVPMVHAGYSAWRKPLLREGVALYELRPEATTARHRVFGSSGASLHSKAFLVDGQRGFVGSFNLDPRSAGLNTEMGVLFDDAGLGDELSRFFEASIQPDTAWCVSLDTGGNLRWHGANGREANREPQTSAGLRTVVRAMQLLPIQSQL